MGIKKNLAYSSFLTLSNYIFGLVVYPYVTRVLGVSNLGTVDFVTNIVAYALLFASFGITMLGIREIAKVKNDRNELNKCYSSLLTLNLIYTIVTLAVYFISICFVDKLSELKTLFIIGSFNILSTTFLVEWLFRGLEDFKYITLRNFAIKIIYVLSVFILVKESKDYTIYYALTVGTIVLNAFVNLMYSRKFVKFSFKNIVLKPYLKSSVSLGTYSLLTSMYTTFNVAFLGFVSNVTQVGLYSAALKLYMILMGLYTAFTSVMMPRGAALISENKTEEYNTLINKSFEVLYTICFPLIVVCVCLAPDIIRLIAGDEFMSATPIMRIIMPLLFVVGVAQILALQVLVPKAKDKYVLRASMLGAIVGITLNILLVPKLHSIGTAITLICTECIVTVYYVYISLKSEMVQIKVSLFVKHFACALPYVIVCMVMLSFDIEYYERLLMCFISCVLYFVVSQTYIIRNSLITGAVMKLIQRLVN